MLGWAGGGWDGGHPEHPPSTEKELIKERRDKMPIGKCRLHQKFQRTATAKLMHTIWRNQRKMGNKHIWQISTPRLFSLRVDEACIVLPVMFLCAPCRLHALWVSTICRLTGASLDLSLKAHIGSWMM